MAMTATSAETTETEKTKTRKDGKKKPSRAQSFALAAEAAGWQVDRIKDGDGGRSAVCRRGQESVIVTWKPAGRGGARALVWALGTHTVQVSVDGSPRTVRVPLDAPAAAMAAVRRPRPVLWAWTAGYLVPLPFDPEVAADDEIASALAGCMIWWPNHYTGKLDAAMVPLSGKQTRLSRTEAGKRVLTFCGQDGAFRSVDVAKIAGIERQAS